MRWRISLQFAIFGVFTKLGYTISLSMEHCQTIFASTFTPPPPQHLYSTFVENPRPCGFSTRSFLLSLLTGYAGKLRDSFQKTPVRSWKQWHPCHLKQLAEQLAVSKEQLAENKARKPQTSIAHCSLLTVIFPQSPNPSPQSPFLSVWLVAIFCHLLHEEA